METAIIIGTIALGICVGGTIALLIMGSDTPKPIKIVTAMSLIPLIICYSIIMGNVKQTEECKAKYKKVDVELYVKVD